MRRYLLLKRKTWTLGAEGPGQDEDEKGQS